MKRLTITLLAIALLSPVFAQSTDKDAKSTIQVVNVASKGEDVRDVLSDMFNQSDKSFVIQPNIHFALFMSLKGVEFEEALNLICKTANLKFELQNGIYFISRDNIGQPPTTPATVPTAPSGKLSPNLLAKKVTVKLKKAELKDLFKQLSAQTGVPLDVNAKVPEYRADVVLNAVTLKYALMTICRVAGLTYRFTDHLTIEIVPREDPNQNIVRLDPH